MLHNSSVFLGWDSFNVFICLYVWLSEKKILSLLRYIIVFLLTKTWHVMVWLNLLVLIIQKWNYLEIWSQIKDKLHATCHLLLSFFSKYKNTLMVVALKSEIRFVFQQNKCALMLHKFLPVYIHRVIILGVITHVSLSLIASLDFFNRFTFISSCIII